MAAMEEAARTPAYVLMVRGDRIAGAVEVAAGMRMKLALALMKPAV